MYIYICAIPNHQDTKPPWVFLLCLVIWYCAGARDLKSPGVPNHRDTVLTLASARLGRLLLSGNDQEIGACETYELEIYIQRRSGHFRQV